MLRRSIALGSLLLCLAGCGDDELAEDVDATLVTIEPVRGTVRIGEHGAGAVARASRGQKLETAGGALARLTLDSGPRLLVGADARIVLAGPDAVSLEAGRLYADVIAGDRLTIDTPAGALSTQDGALSAEVRAGGAAALYVVRGEVSWSTRSGRGTAHAGEEVSLAGGRATTVPALLWSDWTGGLARPGPQGSAAPEGMGTLEARVPDELGLARWPLVVRRLDVRVRVIDDLAITEVEQEFFNPASDTVEGLYRVRVPAGAVLQQFAVDRDGRLVEGYVREKAQARAAYEAQVYRGSTDDPALLEWVSPGSYKAQIYPIPPGATRRIVVRYAEWLTRPTPSSPRLYRYPMGTGSAAPHVQELSLAVELERAGATRVRAGMGATVEANQVLLRRSDFRPRSDFWLELVDSPSATHRLRAYRAPYERPRRAPGSRAITNEADERELLFVPVVLPESLAAPQERSGLDVVVVADVSSGTDRSHLELGRSVVESLTTHLGAQDRVALVTSDVALRSLAPDRRPALGPASRERIEALLEALARTPAGGATDLGAAIGDAAALLDPQRAGIVVYVGDGAPTVGELDAAGLMERMARLPAPVRLYAVGVGGEADLELLEALSAGGGLATRVEERSEAADASLRILAHASRPLASRVTVELGSGIDGVYPRRAVDVVLGEPLVVVGRVRGEVPRTIVVRGTIAGRAFSQRFDLETRKLPAAASDLRLRWAGERLRHLLLEGAGREAVAELGTRYGLITPFTSYYVPSARELREMGESASRLELRPLGADAAPRWALGAARGSGSLSTVFAVVAFAGCSSSERVSTAAGAALQEQEVSSADESRPTTARPPAPQPAAAAAPAQAPTSGLIGGSHTVPIAPPVTTPTTERAAAAAEPEMPANPTPSPAAPPPPPSDPGAAGPSGTPMGATTAAGQDPMAALGALMGDQAGQGFGMGGLGRAGGGSGGSGRGDVGLDDAPAEAGDALASRAVRSQRRDRSEMAGSGAEIDGRFERNRGPRAASRPASQPLRAPVGGESAPRTGASTRETDGWWQRNTDEERSNADRTVLDASTSTDGDADGEGPDVRVTVELGRRRATRRCSDAARLPLEDRRVLWRERLGQGGGVSAWVSAYRRAGRECELPGWRDRRALLDLVLGQSGSVGTMVDVYRQLRGSAAGDYLRGAILRRIHTPADLRLARDAFGLGTEPDWPTVERLLRAAADDGARIRLLRQLGRDYPANMQLRLRLLAALERARRLPEARRLADALRADPLADAAVRTAIGEMFLRLGDRAEARRAFSEIVELASTDELARRRLGDLYRAHGWFEDAYRQYRTLAGIRPDDPTVSLLLAQAAAGAGRVDEALRLEQSLAETAEPGSSSGLARTAMLWSSVRFAKLRLAARGANDSRASRALVARMRRSGVLREAGALRVSLTWSHPDAQLALWGAFPGLPLTRPADLTPELGIEVFEVREETSGTFRFEVRRGGSDLRTPVEAELVVVLHEGRDDERIVVVPLRFAEGRRAYAWTLSGTELAEATPSAQAAPRGSAPAARP